MRPRTITDERLSARQREVLDGIAQGLTPAEVATNLQIAEGTVKVYLQHIAGKLGTTERAAMVHAAYTCGELPAPGRVQWGQADLSLDQMAVLHRLAAGSTVVQVAKELRRPLHAVRRDAREALTALGAANAPQAIRRCWQLGILGDQSTPVRAAKGSP